MSDEQAPVAPTTTSEQDRYTSQQRHINLIWERTQAVIAVSVVLVTLGVAAVLSIMGARTEAAFVFLVGLGNLVVGFYFGRTNHARTGGMRENP